MKPTKPSILTVGAINRSDILAIFTDVVPHANLTFLEYYYNYGEPADPRRYAPYGQVCFWDGFANAHSLLDTLRPDRIVFFYISSLNQVALNVAAQQRGIPTFHLEHGVRLDFGHKIHDQAWSRMKFRPVVLGPRRKELPRAIRNHAFFLRTLPRIRPPARRSLMSFGREVYTRGASPEMLRRYAVLRRPDRYIAFAPASFEFHRIQDDLQAEDLARITYIGLPQFDVFHGLSTTTVDPRNVILIDHQLHNGPFFGWNLEFRRNWVQRLHQILVKELGLRLYVKLHPGDVSNAWDPYLAEGGVELIDHARLCALLPSTRLILGSLSTLQLPLAALPHTALVTLEIHPEPDHFPSRALVDHGVAHAVNSFDELRACLAAPERLAAKQAAHKDTFAQKFLYRADGRSGIRLRDVLLHG